MVRSLLTLFFGALPAVCSYRTFLGRYGFLCPMMTRFPFAGPSGVLSPSSIVLPLKTGDFGRPGWSWWSSFLVAPLPSASLSPHRLLRCSHADGLTAAPSLAYPILHGATLEGACGRGRADDSAGLTEALAGPAIFSTVFLTKFPEPAQTNLLIRILSPSCLVLGPLPAQREGGIRPPTRRSVSRLQKSFPMATVLQVCGQGVGGCSPGMMSRHIKGA